MRIAITSGFYPRILGGAESGLAMLVGGLERAGADVRVYTLGPPSDRAQTLRPFNRVPQRVKLLGSSLLDVGVARALERALAAHPVDVVIARDTYTLPAAVRAARARDLPLLACYPNSVGVPHRSFDVPPVVGAALDRRERTLLSAATQATLVLANSRFTAQRLVDAGVPAARVRALYIHGSVDERCDPPQLEREGPLRVVAAGRLHRHKGFHVLLDAIAEATNRGNEINARIAGSGPARTSLAREIARRGLNASVTLTGRLTGEEVRSLYRWSDVVVVPSVVPEPFGRVAAEAMAEARPVVGSDAGGLPELVGEAGLLFPPGDASQLADHLVRLSKDRSLVVRLGAAALERMHAMFGGNKTAVELLDICRGVTMHREGHA